MCLFTHFAAGALVGGLVGHPVAGAVAGIASHAVLDMIPHYDHPDWRLELLGGAGALVLMLAMPFSSLAAVLGGLGGMLPDLENLFQKLGWYSRRRFLFPTHNGILPHGRRLDRGSLRWQAAIFVGCFLLLGIGAPGHASAATQLPGAEAVLGPAQVTVLLSSPDRTVVRVQVPVLKSPADWSDVAFGSIQWGDPLVVDAKPSGPVQFLPPHRSFSLAVPTLTKPQILVRQVRWLREPQGTWDDSSLVLTAAPRIFRSVPLSGCDVNLGAGGGVLGVLVLEINHPRQGNFATALDKAGKADARDRAGLVLPYGLLNADLFGALSRGAVQQALERDAATAKADAQSSSLFGDTNHWVRLDVRANGPVRLTGAELSGMGVPVTSVDPDKLRLYRGGGMALDLDPTVPDQDQADRVGLTEVAIEVTGDQDQEWNLDDELRFYAVATSAWRDRFPGPAPRLDFYDHPFADHATYWLTWEDARTASNLPGNPLRMVHDSAAPTGGPEVASARIRLHREKQLLDQAGLFQDNWAWDNFVYSSRQDTFSLRHPVAGSGARFVVDIRGAFYAYRADYPFRAEVWLNGDSAGKATLDFISGDPGDSDRNQNDPDSLRVRVVGSSGDIHDGLNNLTLSNASQPSGDYAKQALALDSFDISYRADLVLDPGRGEMEPIFATSEPGLDTAPFDIRIGVPGGGDIHVWDVTDPAQPRILSGLRDLGDPEVHRVGYALPDAADHQLALFRDGAFLAVTGGVVAQPRDLRAAPTDYDHLTVYAPGFALAGDALAAYRATAISGNSQPAAAAVSAQDIYDSFAGGQKDPHAIRNYLKWVYEQSGHRLRYACFIGNASRDYRNYLGHPVGQGLYDFLPTEIKTVFPQYPQSGTSAAAYAADDGLVSFDAAGSNPEDYPDLACGRLPVATANEAMDLVTRIISYDGNPEPGPWRNRVVFAADDANRPETGSKPSSGETYHTTQADYLTENEIPLSLDVTKIYGVAYSFPSPSSNSKPKMRQDINAAMNAGTTIFNYTGHGAEDNLADEQVFQSRDIPNLFNGMQRLVFIAFSCDVGVFDSPNRWSMAEQFLTSSNGGAIASISASQVSYSISNNRLSTSFYAQLFPGLRVDPDQSLGSALEQAKGMMISDGDISNSQHFNLMGDPALSLPNPPDILTFAPGGADTLRAGTRQTIIMSPIGSYPPQPGDTYDVRVEDSEFDQAFTVYNYSGTPIQSTYRRKGTTIFRGTGVDQTMTLEVPFMNPVQFRYGDEARIRMIVSGAGISRVGVARVSSVRGGGAVSSDVTGPRIDLSFADNRYRVRTGSLLTADLTDSNGIAILGTSPGNSLLLEFDDSGFMTDVTPSFTFDPNSFTTGQLSFPLPGDLDLGKHRAALHASDALGNVGSDTLSFQLIPEGVRGLESVTLFPNPTPGPCRLLFDLSDPMTVQWEIYTLAGRRLRTIREDFGVPGPSILSWDGRDQQGDEIANGTYLFVLRGLAHAEDEREITKTGKLVVMR